MSHNGQIIEIPTERSKLLIYEIIENLNIKHTDIFVTRATQKGDNYLSDIFRIKIKNKSENVLSLIIKIAPPIEIRGHMDINKIFGREIFVYSELLPILYQIQEDNGIEEDERFQITKLYKSCCEELDEMLIMEDLNEKGFKMYDRQNALDFSHASLCIKTIARFHASTIILNDRSPAYYNIVKNRSIDMDEISECYKSLVKSSKPVILKECLEEPYYDKMVELYENMYDELVMLVDSKSAAPYNIICHGDCWNNNFLFKYVDEKVIDMRLVDWQLLREASPVTDISYMLFLSSDKELRRNHYNELLDLYYQTLSSHVTKMGVNIDNYYPQHIFRKQLKKFMRFGLIISIIALPFVLCDEGEAVDLSSIIDKEATITPNERSAKRIKDLIEDCIEYGYL